MGRSGGAHDLHEMFVCLAFGIGVSIYATHVLLASYNSPSQKWRAIFISSPVSFRVAFLFEAKNEKLSASFFSSAIMTTSLKFMIAQLKEADLSWEQKAAVLAPEVNKLCEQFEKGANLQPATQAFIAELLGFCCVRLNHGGLECFCEIIIDIYIYIYTAWCIHKMIFFGVDLFFNDVVYARICVSSTMNV